MWARLKLIFNIKKAKTRVVLLLFVTFLGLLISAFFTREEILEWKVVNFASEQGLQKFSLNVEDIDFRESSFSDLKGSNDALSFAINEVELRYNPKEIVNKKIQALSISGLKANFNVVDQKSDSNRSEFFLMQEIFNEVKKFIEIPKLNYLRMRNSDLSIIYKNIQTVLNLDFFKADFIENFLKLDWKGAVNDVPFYSNLSLDFEEGKNFFTAFLEVPDLAALYTQLKENPYFRNKFSIDPHILSGSVTLDAYAQILPDKLEDRFVELNVTNLDFSFLDNNFSIPKLISFLIVDENEKLRMNSYGHFLFDQNLIAEDIKLSLLKEKEELILNGGVSHLETRNKFPNIEVKGLRIPEFRFSTDNMKLQFIGDEKKIAFDQILFEKNFLNLYSGFLSFVFTDKETVELRLPPLDMLLPELGLAFVDFSYSGTIHIDELPLVQNTQLITAKRILLDDDALFEDFSLSMTVRDLNCYTIDLISLKYQGHRIVLNPQEMVLKVNDNNAQSVSIVLRNATLELPNSEIIISGINGKVDLLSTDPLETNGSQYVSFEKIEDRRGLEILDGNFSFIIDPSGFFEITESKASFYDGAFNFNESIFDFVGDKMRIKCIIDEIDGQRIIESAENILDVEFDLDINGTLSGSIPFIFRDGKWDFEKGYAELDQNENAKLFYYGPFVYEPFMQAGLQKAAEEEIQLTKKALENLDLESLIINLEADGQERYIKIGIKGSSQVDEKRKVFLNYKPKVIAGLTDLLSYLNN